MNDQEVELSNYQKYRGKCKQMCEELVKNDSTLTMVRGYYYEPLWSKDEQHWWCEDTDGNIIDPTCLQFPSGGVKEFYTKFDGNVECDNCHKQLKEEDAIIDGRYCFCSNKCYGQFVGVYI